MLCHGNLRNHRGPATGLLIVPDKGSITKATSPTPTLAPLRTMRTPMTIRPTIAIGTITGNLGYLYSVIHTPRFIYTSEEKNIVIKTVSLLNGGSIIIDFRRITANYISILG